MERVAELDGWARVFVHSVTEMGERLGAFLPSLAAALAILVIGWIVSRIVEGVSQRVLHRVGLDRSAQRLRVSETLEQGGVQSPPSRIVSRLLFWVLMLTFVLSAVESLGLTAATATIDRLIGFLPDVIAASLVLFGGLLLGRFVRGAVASGAAATQLAYAERLGDAAQLAVVVLAGVLALSQIGVDTAALVTVLTALVATFGVTLGIAFSLGARGVVAHILAGHYLRQSLPVGRNAEVQGRSGVVEEVGPVSTSFRSGDRTWSVPNAQLLEEVVVH